MINKKIIFCILGFILTTFLSFYIYQSYYLGDYIIEEQWINSSYQGKLYCDNCLWIKFSEGCNRYPVYYFENQHTFDNRFSKGSIVNINLVNGYIKGINLARRYETKCYSEMDLNNYFVLLINSIFWFIILFILLNKQSKNGN